MFKQSRSMPMYAHSYRDKKKSSAMARFTTLSIATSLAVITFPLGQASYGQEHGMFIPGGNCRNEYRYVYDTGARRGVMRTVPICTPNLQRSNSGSARNTRSMTRTDIKQTISSLSDNEAQRWAQNSLTRTFEECSGSFQLSTPTCVCVVQTAYEQLSAREIVSVALHRTHLGDNAPEVKPGWAIYQSCQ